MINNRGKLALELSDHLLGNLQRERERGTQAHDWKRLQGSDFRAE